MSALRRAAYYLKEIKNDRIDLGDILAIRLTKILCYLRLWWTEEDFKGTSAVDKLTCLFSSMAYLGTFFGVFIYTYEFRRDHDLPIILGNLSYFLVSLLAVYGVGLFHYKRAPLTKAIQATNETNWNMLRRADSLKYRPHRNRIHLLCLGIFAMGVLVGFITSLSLFLVFLATGQDYFKNHLTADKPPYSVLPFANAILNSFLVVWVVIFYTPIFVIIIEAFLIISLNYRVLAADLRAIDVVAAVEGPILQGLIKELQNLESLIQELNGIVWSFWTVYITLVLSTLGLFISVILTVDSVIDNLAFVTWPVFLFLYMALFCGIGQHVKDSVAEVQLAIYSCEWYSAAMPFRKMILMLLIRCMREAKMDAKPFFEWDYNLLAKVVKSAYAMIALVLNMTR